MIQESIKKIRSEYNKQGVKQVSLLKTNQEREKRHKRTILMIKKKETQLQIQQ